jgi:hypothetical protein
VDPVGSGQLDFWVIEFRSEPLFETRVSWRRIGTTNIPSNNPRRLAQFSQRPFEICNREAASFPIRYRGARIETVEINCDVNIFSLGRFHKLLKVPAPVIAQDRAPAFSIFGTAIVRPGMNVQHACAFRSTITENLVRPPALEISAAPDARTFEVFQLQCAINPTATSPLGRTHIPVRVVIERNENEWSGNATEPKRRQIVEVARSVEQKRRSEIRFVLTIKLGDQMWRRREAQPWAPPACVNHRKTQRLIPPRVIQIEMKSAANQKLVVCLPKKLNVARFRDAQIFLGLFVIGIQAQRFTKLNDGLRDLTLSQVKPA